MKTIKTKVLSKTVKNPRKSKAQDRPYVKPKSSTRPQGLKDTKMTDGKAKSVKNTKKILRPQSRKNTGRSLEMSKPVKVSSNKKDKKILRPQSRKKNDSRSLRKITGKDNKPRTDDTTKTRRINGQGNERIHRSSNVHRFTKKLNVNKRAKKVEGLRKGKDVALFTKKINKIYREIKARRALRKVREQSKRLEVKKPLVTKVSKKIEAKKDGALRSLKDAKVPKNAKVLEVGNTKVAKKNPKAKSKLVGASKLVSKESKKEVKIADEVLEAKAINKAKRVSLPKPSKQMKELYESEHGKGKVLVGKKAVTFNDRYRQEVQKLLEQAKKKGTLNEEDIILRFLNFDASIDDIKKISKYLASQGIVVREAKDQPEEIEDINKIASQIQVGDPVKMYLKDIGKVALLTSDQEVEYAKRMVEGDETARRNLAEANLRLVLSSLLE